MPRLVTYRGTAKTLSAWAREIGVNRTTILERMKRGWPIDESFVPPSEALSNRPQCRRPEAA